MFAVEFLSNKFVVTFVVPLFRIDINQCQDLRSKTLESKSVVVNYVNPNEDHRY